MSREKGDKLETKVSNDFHVNKTTNSGAKWDNADLSNRDVIIECKYKDKPSLSSVGPEVKKLINQATKHGKEWIYIQENKAGTFAIIDYNYLLELYMIAYKDRI